MTNWQILIVVLLTTGIALSAVRYARSRLSLRTKIILITLRTAWIVGLLIAFLEPTIRFERFESGRMKIPVLIDVSASMQNFSPDDFVLPFIDTLRSLQSGSNNAVSFEYFLFGDSTRVYSHQQHQSSRARLLFDDTKTFFPRSLYAAGENLSGDMIIVTDGHFTNPIAASEIFPRHVIHYLTLPDASPHPFVTVSADAPESSAGDSLFTVNVTLNGYAKDAAAVVVLLKEATREIARETIEIERGRFARETRFRIRSSHPGRRLYSVEASIGDAPPSVSSFVHQTVPHYLSYSIYSARPALDRRFLSQTLASDNFYRASATLPDILFLFDYDTTAARLVRALPRHSVVVYMGAMPCSTNIISEPSITIRPLVDNNVITSQTDLRNIPPPQMILSCRQLPISGVRRILQANINQTTQNIAAQNVRQNQNAAAQNVRQNQSAAAQNVRQNQNINARQDQTTFDILLSGRFLNRHSLFFPVVGLWRFDFWPMSRGRAESELFGFSNMLVNLAREMLLDNLSDQLMIYPARDLTETDSARFMMSLPAALPVFEPAQLAVKIDGENFVIDTIINYIPQGLNRQPLSFAPLPQGDYRMTATLGGDVRAAFDGNFTINKDMSELSVLSQNTQYLQEFARPLDTRGDDFGFDNVAILFDSWQERSLARRAVTDAVRLHRSWLLLLIVLTIFGAELVLRRVKSVD